MNRNNVRKKTIVIVATVLAIQVVMGTAHAEEESIFKAGSGGQITMVEKKQEKSYLPFTEILSLCEFLY